MSEQPPEPAPARLGTWVMALVRLGTGWLVLARPLNLLMADPSPLEVPAALRFALAALLGAGLGAFAWPRGYRWGLALLLGGLAVYELLARQHGLPPTPRLLTAVAILVVLAAGQWLTRRVEGRR